MLLRKQSKLGIILTAGSKYLGSVPPWSSHWLQPWAESAWMMNVRLHLIRATDATGVITAAITSITASSSDSSSSSYRSAYRTIVRPDTGMPDARTNRPDRTAGRKSRLLVTPRGKLLQIICRPEFRPCAPILPMRQAPVVAVAVSMTDDYWSNAAHNHDDGDISGNDQTRP